MDIEGFSRELHKRGVGPGAVWRKADFHIHVPGSSDYRYRGGDAVDVLGEAIDAAGCAFAVALKHQEFPSRDELQALQARCPNTLLIPGAELNVLVDALFKKIGRDYFFHCIAAVDPRQEGDYGYVLRRAQEQFIYRAGDYPAGFRSNIVDVGRFFRENGALFIPAHLHQAKTPDESRSVDDLYDDEAFLGFVSAGAFDALEVRQPSTAAFFEGGRRTKEGLAIPRSVCVASTDAHHHEDFAQRRRGTWVRVEELTFPELAAALSFPHRVSISEPPVAHPRVLGLHVVGAFLKDAWIVLNEGLNAFIGSKGSGKTAVLECLRFVLNTPVPSERADAVKRHLAHILGSSGYVECLVMRDNGQRLLMTRRADSADRITLLHSNGEVSTLTAKQSVPFPISILGWHEIESVADKPSARIELLDRVGEESEVQRHRDGINQQVEKARDILPLLQRQVKKLDGALRRLWDLQEKRSTLTRLEQADLLAIQEQYEWFLLTEQKLSGVRELTIKRQEAIPEALSGHVSLGLSDPPDVASVGRASEYLASVVQAVDANADSEEQGKRAAVEGLERINSAAFEASAELAKVFAMFRESVYRPKVDALPPADREVLTRQIQVLEETKRLPVVENECSELLREVKGLAKQLRDFCDAICGLREEIVAYRESLISSVNEELSTVRLRFLRSSNHEDRQRFADRHGTEGKALLGYVQEFGSGEDAYGRLRALFGRLLDLELTRGAWSVKDALWDVRLVELLDVLDEDDVELSLAVGTARFVPIQSLSAGQRCVAVFPLLLRNTRGPLVIDQPEDNLDNRYIADTIAPDLLRLKRAQQFVVSSHNANLVVLTDADLAVHMDSDGTTCGFPAAGFFSCSTSRVKESVLDVLDGGEAALAARQRKYGTRI